MAEYHSKEPLKKKKKKNVISIWAKMPNDYT